MVGFEPGDAEWIDEGHRRIHWATMAPSFINKFCNFFLQNNLFKFKNGTQENTKTNHYILLTNVSIKRCIIPSSDQIFSGGRIIIFVTYLLKRELIFNFCKWKSFLLLIPVNCDGLSFAFKQSSTISLSKKWIILRGRSCANNKTFLQFRPSEVFYNSRRRRRRRRQYLSKKNVSDKTLNFGDNK